MGRAKSGCTGVLRLVAALVAASQTAFGQASKIPPRYIEEWSTSRLPFAIILGAVLGAIVAALWLPRLLPVPHADDNWRARRRFMWALLLSVLIAAGLLLTDINVNYEFGRQSYEIKETFFQVFLTWPTIKLLIFFSLSFTGMVALLSRLSGKPYRYMLSRW